MTVLPRVAPRDYLVADLRIVAAEHSAAHLDYLNELFAAAEAEPERNVFEIFDDERFEDARPGVTMRAAIALQNDVASICHGQRHRSEYREWRQAAARRAANLRSRTGTFDGLLP